MKNIEYIPDKIVTMQIQKMPKYNLILLISLSFIFKVPLSIFYTLLSNKFDNLLFNFAPSWLRSLKNKFWGFFNRKADSFSNSKINLYHNA